MADAQSRREFLTRSAAGVAGLAASQLIPGSAHAQALGKVDPGRLVHVRHPGVLKLRKGKIGGRKILHEDIVQQMVHKALTTWTGESDPVAALGKFVTKDEVVGLKVSTLGSPVTATHPDITYALVDLLHKIGLTNDQIIIYDQYGSRMRRGGYKLKDRKGKIRVIRHWGESSSKEDPKWGYGKMEMTPAGPTRFCKILDEITAMIALPVPKDHDLTGVTGAMKNVSFGHIDIAPKFHCNKGYGWVDGEKKKQKGLCQPVCKWGACNVARLYAHERLRNKIRFHLADATAVLYQGGPQYKARYTKPYHSIIMATDPVAMDQYFLEIVDAMRAEKKMKPIAEIKRPRKRPAAFIAHAEQLGLGVADPAKRKLEEINLG